ncbi:MAG TPA: hypothetical protein VJK03_02875 [Candidatus Nanoarchaeia archaeon]|nr:hypothetical protein [Candidatus Nanoarchaeia archaeon]
MNIRSIPVYATLCTALLGAGCATTMQAPRYGSPNKAWTTFYNSMDEKHLTRGEKRTILEFQSLPVPEQERKWGKILDLKNELINGLPEDERKRRSLKDILLQYHYYDSMEKGIKGKPVIVD